VNRQIISKAIICFFLAGFVFFYSSCVKDPVDTGKETFTDPRDESVYQWAKIGTQTWMARNLAYLPAVSPSAEGSDSTGFSYVYGYESIYVNTAKAALNYATYGVLYNWPSALKACPEGWHLPTDAECDVLSGFLGGDSVSGTSLKSKDGWKDKGNGDNSSGFIGLPGGYRNKAGGFFLLGDNAGFWTATPGDSASTAIVRDLGYNYQEFGRSSYRKNGGFSVRCLKD